VGDSKRDADRPPKATSNFQAILQPLRWIFLADPLGESVVIRFGTGYKTRI
jgi:hypothetical protein